MISIKTLAIWVFGTGAHVVLSCVSLGWAFHLTNLCSRRSLGLPASAAACVTSSFFYAPDYLALTKFIYAGV